MNKADVIIVGGGAAGLAAAGIVSHLGCKTIVLERNEKAGKKLYITGKGRCNVTNNCEPREFLENVVSGAKFLTGCIYRFSPSKTMDLFDELGLKLKTERGGRVFPESDKSSDVIKALKKYAESGGSRLITDARVKTVEKSAEGFIIETEGGLSYSCEKVILACGGVSYPATGSDGGGFELAKVLGHSIVKPVSGLVPIRLKEDVSSLEGLSLKNVTAAVKCFGFEKTMFGEMLFTRDGVSGPVVLSLSSFINRMNLSDCKFTIDLKPALSREKLDVRILSDFKKYSNKQLKNSLSDLLPKKLIPFIIDYCNLDGEKPLNIITKAEREKLLEAMKALTFKIDSLYPKECGIVTSGGVNLKEVNPKSMESKIVKGLFFAGEILDVDALTGGFNIQIALSTGFCAGEGAGGNNGD